MLADGGDAESANAPFPATDPMPLPQPSRLSSRDRAAQLLIAPAALMSLNLVEAKIIVSYMQPETVPAGETFITEGDAVNNGFMVLLLQGEVLVENITVSRTKPVTVTVLGPGSLIGEMGLLDTGPRSASCTASTDIQCAVLTREALETLSMMGHHIDTSHLRANALRAFVKDFVALDERQGLTLLFESFGFKHGIPLDADLVFDVRCLPNPHYDPALRPLTGRDTEVINFLSAESDVQRMEADIFRFLSDWLPGYVRDNRTYLTVAIGCTGGQHRSVYIAEKLAAELSKRHKQVMSRHNELPETEGRITVPQFGGT